MILGFNPLRSAEDIETVTWIEDLVQLIGFNPLRSAEDIETYLFAAGEHRRIALQSTSIRRGY